MLYFFYDSMVGLDAVAAGIAAGHGDSRVDDIAVTAGSFPFDNGYFIARLDESGAFHLKFYCSHDESSPFFYSRGGFDHDIYYKTRVKKCKERKNERKSYVLL